MSKSPFDSDTSLTPAQQRVEQQMEAPNRRDTRDLPAIGYRVHPSARIFVRGPWEMGASIVIGLGVFMLMQPFFVWAFTYSFIVLLIGTVGFIIVSHFPE